MNKNIDEFWNAANEGLFNQKEIASVFGISCAKLERDRWLGEGIPYLKLGGFIRYRKANVLSWIKKHEVLTSPSKYEGGNTQWRKDME